MQQLNIEDFIPAPDSGQLRSVEAPINQAAALMRQIDGMEAALKQMQLELTTLNTKTIPEAMASAGVSEFKTTAGVKVKLNQFLSGSLPKLPAARAAALEWIHEQNADDLIKWGITVTLDKGDTDGAERTKRALRQANVGFDEKQDIHAQTLCAFARERLRNGEAVPLELLGLYAGTVAKVELPKTAPRGFEAPTNSRIVANPANILGMDGVPHMDAPRMTVAHRTTQEAMPAAPVKRSRPAKPKAAKKKA